MSELNSQDYAKFFREIKGYIRDRQLQAMRSVNRELVALYWDIGQLIHQKQEALGWGKSVVETLARDLQAEFPGRNGFSAQNLWFMRQFYSEYVGKPNLQPLVREISWTKNLIIFSRDLEQALVKNVRAFLSEMGGSFAFMGNQYRLEVGGQEYFIDLLLFHRRLRCLVAIELKIGDFKPEHKGKMEFYLEALDCQERVEGENPPIGMIICRSKNKTVVEYALRNAVRPIGVATYSIVPQLPDVYRDELPSPEAIAERLRLWDDREVEDE